MRIQKPTVLAEPIIPADNRILYFGRDRAAFRFLSHFWPSPIELDNKSWPTVEHYYQAQKCHDLAYREAVRVAPAPAVAKRLAAQPSAPRKISSDSWFKHHGMQPRPDWHEVKLDIMRRADWAKFIQHPQLAQLLLGTGDAELVEDSATEPFWGIGPDGEGANWAGKVLMEVRDKLRANQDAGSTH